jgi:hypothetical protein
VWLIFDWRLSNLDRDNQDNLLSDQAHSTSAHYTIYPCLLYLSSSLFPPIYDTIIYYLNDNQSKLKLTTLYWYIHPTLDYLSLVRILTIWPFQFELPNPIRKHLPILQYLHYEMYTFCNDTQRCVGGRLGIFFYW